MGGARFLLAEPVDRLGRPILGEVTALFGGLFRLDRHRAVIDRGIQLVGLITDEAVKILKPAAAGGPGIERADGAVLPDRDFMAFAELRGAVTVQLQGAVNRPDDVGQPRACAGTEAATRRSARFAVVWTWARGQIAPAKWKAPSAALFSDFAASAIWVRPRATDGKLISACTICSGASAATCSITRAGAATR